MPVTRSMTRDATCDATCVVCLERCRPVPLPCCGVAGAGDQICRACADQTFDPRRPTKCPKCRAWLVGSGDGFVVCAAVPAVGAEMQRVLDEIPRAFVEQAILVALAPEHSDVAGMDMARQLVSAHRGTVVVSSTRNRVPPVGVAGSNPVACVEDVVSTGSIPGVLQIR